MIHLHAPLELPELPAHVHIDAPAQPEFKIAPRKYAIYAEPKKGTRMYLSGHEFTADALAADYFSTKNKAYQVRRRLELFSCGIISSRGKIWFSSKCRKLPIPRLKNREKMEGCSDFVCIKSIDGKNHWLDEHGAWSENPCVVEHFSTQPAARKAANKIGDYGATVGAIPDRLYVDWLLFSLLTGMDAELKKMEREKIKITSKLRTPVEQKALKKNTRPGSG